MTNQNDYLKHYSEIRPKEHMQKGNAVTLITY